MVVQLLSILWLLTFWNLSSSRRVWLPELSFQPHSSEDSQHRSFRGAHFNSHDILLKSQSGVTHKDRLEQGALAGTRGGVHSALRKLGVFLAG